MKRKLFCNSPPIPLPFSSPISPPPHVEILNRLSHIQTQLDTLQYQVDRIERALGIEETSNLFEQHTILQEEPNYPLSFFLSETLPIEEDFLSETLPIEEDFLSETLPIEEDFLSETLPIEEEEQKEENNNPSIVEQILKL